MKLKNTKKLGPAPSAKKSVIGTGPEKAFTLVELIVVITILAILGTIAFISLQGYSSQSRDSVRVSDMSRMKTGLELFQLDAGKYPIPTDGTEITYSGGVVWTQGYFGDSTYKNVGKLDKIPLDPLTDKKYVYSTTNTRQEFQIAGVMEGDEVTFNSNQVNAGEKTAILKITGNYNGKVLKVSTGSKDYVLAVPSIITNTGITDIVSIVANDNLSYNGYKNLPYQYNGSRYNIEGDKGINLMNASDLVVFSGVLKGLSSAETVGINARKALLISLQNAYTGTTIKNVGSIARILATDSTNTGSTELLMSNMVSNNLGGSIIAGGNTDNNGLGDWTDEDSNCTIADITIGSQTWAGCNSTLGTGIEYNGTTNYCYNYDKDGNGFNDALGTTCLSGNYGDSNDNAKSYYDSLAGAGNVNGDSEVDNIWGKLYTWTSMDTDSDGDIDVNDINLVCGIGYHVPTDAEFTTLENYVFGSICAGDTFDRDSNLTADGNGWGCEGLGWKFHSTTNSGISIAELLHIPFPGYRNTNEVTYSYRGNGTFLWTSTEVSTSARGRSLNWDYSTVFRDIWDKANGFSVRCIKD